MGRVYGNLDLNINAAGEKMEVKGACSVKIVNESTGSISKPQSTASNTSMIALPFEIVTNAALQVGHLSEELGRYKNVYFRLVISISVELNSSGNATRKSAAKASPTSFPGIYPTHLMFFQAP
jgi:hypothetical protein